MLAVLDQTSSAPVHAVSQHASVQRHRHERDGAEQAVQPERPRRVRQLPEQPVLRQLLDRVPVFDTSSPVQSSRKSRCRSTLQGPKGPAFVAAFGGSGSGAVAGTVMLATYQSRPSVCNARTRARGADGGRLPMTPLRDSPTARQDVSRVADPRLLTAAQRTAALPRAPAIAPLDPPRLDPAPRRPRAAQSPTSSRGPRPGDNSRVDNKSPVRHPEPDVLPGPGRRTRRDAWSKGRTRNSRAAGVWPGAACWRAWLRR